MEPEGPLPYSQASATYPYPGPTQSSPHTHIPPHKFYHVKLSVFSVCLPFVYRRNYDYILGVKWGLNPTKQNKPWSSSFFNIISNLQGFTFDL